MSKNVSNPTLNPRGNVHRPLPYSKPFQCPPATSPRPAAPGSPSHAFPVIYPRVFPKLPAWLAPTSQDSSPRLLQMNFLHQPNWICTLFPKHPVGTPTSTTLGHRGPLTLLASPPLPPGPAGQAQLKALPFQEASPGTLLPWAVAASCEVWQISLSARLPYLF